MKRISLTISEDILKQLDELCSAFGCSRSHLIRIIVEAQYFNYVAHPNYKLNIKRK